MRSKLFILSAGLGERLRPLTETTPKPLVPLCDIPMLIYPFVHFMDFELQSVVVNTFHLRNKMTENITQLNLPFPVEFSHEEPVILGSGGGIWGAKKYLIDTDLFYVANADSVFFPDDPGFMEEVAEKHLTENNLATLAVINNPGWTQSHGGIWVDTDERILGIGREQPDGAERCLHFIGYQVYSPKIFEFLPAGQSHIFQDTLLKILDRQKVKVCEVSGEWFETGNPTDLQKTEHAIQKKYLNHPVFLKAQKFGDFLI